MVKYKKLRKIKHGESQREMNSDTWDEPDTDAH